MTFRQSWRRVLAAAVIAGAATGAVLAPSPALAAPVQADPVQGIGLAGNASCTPDYVLAGWHLTNANATPATVTALDAGPVEMSGIEVGSVIPAAAGGQPGQLTGTQEHSPAYDGPFSLAVTVNLAGQSVSLSLTYDIDENCQPISGDPGEPTKPPATQTPAPEPTATAATPVPTTPAAGGPSLPVTGGNPLPIVAAGLALLVGGALLATVVVRRRRDRFVS